MAEIDTALRPNFADVSPRERDHPEPGILPPAERELLARDLEQQIREHPLRYFRAMEALGEAATAGSANVLSGLNLPDADLGAAARIHRYFLRHADGGVEYDAATEAALLQDDKNRSALAAFQKAKPYTALKAGSKSSHEPRPHPDAVPTRNAVRRIRLTFYIGEAAASWARELLRPDEELAA